MKSFKYPLAGEFSLEEYFTRIKNFIRLGNRNWNFVRNAKKLFPQNICQVDLADTYDHKHQDLSINDEKKVFQECRLI